MNILVYQSVILGIIQGIAEFLPISSSAHLIFVPYLFSWDMGNEQSKLIFDIALHFGTLIAVVIFFFKDFWNITISGLTKGVKDVNGKLFWMLCAATLPGAIIGKLLDDHFDTFFRDNIVIIGILFIIMGIVIYVVDKFSKSEVDFKDLTWKQTFLVGFSQAIAFLPGVSRSGITMTTARLLKIDREAAARFSFLLSAPITLGAVIFKLKDMSLSMLTPSFFIGVITSAIVGIVTIKFLLAYIKKNDFKLFAIYRVILGIIILTIFFIR